MTQLSYSETPVYQGQFGEFTITESDRTGVMIYRSALMIAALSFAIGCGLVLWSGTSPWVGPLTTLLYLTFSLALGVSLLMIHIYMVVLHRTLQAFWLIGSVSAIAIALSRPEPLALTVYHHPMTLLGIGFTFAALTGIYFKEAFCFDRLETKILTPLVPFLLLGHLTGILPVSVERGLLVVWATFFVVFAARKLFQGIPADIGDKSVFTYLKQQRTAQNESH